jgi:hypothetical protein
MRVPTVALCLTVLLAAAARAAAPAGGADAAGGLPPADIRVEKAADTVILTDGTKLTGTILAAGQRAVIIIEQDQISERVIPRSEVESFSYASRGSGEVKGYATGVHPDEGLPVIVGEGSGAPGGTSNTPKPPTANNPAPSPKPNPGPNPSPKSTPNPNKPGKDLSKLWTLLGTANADELKAAVNANPEWRGEIRKIMNGEVPADGADAVAKFKDRLAKDPALQKLIVDWTNRQGRMPRQGGGGQKGG